MAEPAGGSGLPEFPRAVEAPRRGWVLPLVWLVPLVAILAGGWLAVQAIMNKGPTITISFLSAEGLEAGKTKIRIKEVEVGLVTAIALAEDNSRVIVTAELPRDAERFLVEDTRFWVVRPKVGRGGISGLGTLFSGAYIGVEVGTSTKESRHFVGLESPPVLTIGRAGRAFVLKANDIASIGQGTPVYYRRIEAGEVTGYTLDADGRGVSLEVFVNAPYERYVTAQTRFWQASGIDLELDAQGLQIQTESLVSVLSGGIAFGTPPEAPPAEPAPAGSEFRLYPRRVEAFKQADTRVETYAFVFRESLRGLAVGAPLDFRGIILGEVSRIGAELRSDTKRIDMVVEARVYPERLRALAVGRSRDSTEVTDEQLRARLVELVEGGLRAQLRTGNLLTGQLYLALDFFPEAPAAHIDFASTPVRLPTTQGGLQEIQQTVASIARKLDAVPFDTLSADLTKTLESLTKVAARLEALPYEGIAKDLRAALTTLESALKSMDALAQQFDGELAPELKATLVDTRRTLTTAEQALAPDAPLTTEMRGALREMSRAAESVRVLVDYLERDPSAVLKGKPKEQP